MQHGWSTGSVANSNQTYNLGNGITCTYRDWAMNPIPLDQYRDGILWCHTKRYLRGITQEDYSSKSPVPAITSEQQAMAVLRNVTRAWP